MPALNRQTLIKIHMLLAAFTFPAALMFLVTGGLYTWGIKGSYLPEAYTIELASPLSSDAKALKALAESELQRLAIDPPSGDASVKAGGTSFKLEWTGSRRDVVLEPTADELVARLTVKDTTWYRNLVQLHKAKGGEPFKVYAAGLAIALFAILLSGFVMAWQVPKLRSQALVFSLLGVAAFVLVLLGS